ncbi:uncharacterized protein LOC121386026 isoform X2 [Gigantopelta aegis]|uniref:uncharacterized protein LOC121386026 isoform X2 n=1 Tax=Gigantopelta aegis TaxID=1735272 RepID=UPI001B88B296|nr:uncharacterized protein LOC121386026 isoform X2 [Gigantopelta aegis]
MFTRKTMDLIFYLSTIIINCVSIEIGSYITNREKVALIRGVLFTEFVCRVFLPVVNITHDWVKPNTYTPVPHNSGVLATANKTFSGITATSTDLDVYHHFLSQEDYLAVEFNCWVALLIITLTNQADRRLIAYRQPYLRRTWIYPLIMTVRKFLMGGIVLSGIICMIISWMRIKSSDTVILLPWQKFNPCAVLTEVMTVSKFVLSILMFCSSISKCPNIFGQLIRKRFLCGIGLAEIVMFLICTASVEVTKTCRGMAELTLYAAIVFSGVVILWNFVSANWTQITSGITLNFIDFALVGGPNRIPQNDHHPLDDNLTEDLVDLPVYRDEEKMLLIINHDVKYETDLVVLLVLQPSSPRQPPVCNDFSLKMGDKMMFTSLNLLSIKQMSWPKTIQFERFAKSDIIQLYHALYKCFEPLRCEHFAIKLYQNCQLGIEVGSAGDLLFCICLNEALEKRVTQIHIDKEMARRSTGSQKPGLSLTGFRL